MPVVPELPPVEEGDDVPLVEEADDAPLLEEADEAPVLDADEAPALEDAPEVDAVAPVDPVVDDPLPVAEPALVELEVVVPEADALEVPLAPLAEAIEPAVEVLPAVEGLPQPHSTPTSRIRSARSKRDRAFMPASLPSGEAPRCAQLLAEV